MSLLARFDKIVAKLELLGADSKYVGVAGGELLDVALGFFVEDGLRHQRDRKEPLVGKRDRAVLHLARRVALGVQIGDLFEL